MNKMPKIDKFVFNADYSNLAAQIISEVDDEVIATIISDKILIPDEGEKLDLASILTEDGEMEGMKLEGEYIVNSKSYRYGKIEWGDDEKKDGEELLSIVAIYVRPRRVEPNG